MLGGREIVLVDGKAGSQRSDLGDRSDIHIDIGRADGRGIVGEVLVKPLQIRRRADVFLHAGNSLIGHRYWTMTGTDRVDGMDSFFKKLSIMGGFLLLYYWYGKIFD